MTEFFVKEALEALVTEMIEKGILFDEARTEFERRFIKQILDRHDGNQSKAALALGMHRNTLSRKMVELQLHEAPASKGTGRRSRPKTA